MLPIDRHFDQSSTQTSTAGVAVASTSVKTIVKDEIEEWVLESVDNSILVVMLTGNDNSF